MLSLIKLVSFTGRVFFGKTLKGGLHKWELVDSSDDDELEDGKKNGLGNSGRGDKFLTGVVASQPPVLIL
jgi:hypothetical protein